MYTKKTPKEVQTTTVPYNEIDSIALIQQQYQATMKTLELKKQERERYLQLLQEYNKETSTKTVKKPNAPILSLPPPARDPELTRTTTATKTTSRSPSRKRTYSGSSGDNLPFTPENELDERIIAIYQNRILPADSTLPRISLTKRNGKYWLGQRRFEAVFTEINQVCVKEGTTLTALSDWLEKTERLESLKLKGLLSAQPLLLQDSAISRTKLFHTRLSTQF